MFVSGSRREEFGTAQMEALADGTPLAAVPSLGATEPVAVARRLRPDLVATEISAEALGVVIRRALALEGDERAAYAAGAAALMGAYSTRAFDERLAATSCRCC